MAKSFNKKKINERFFHLFSGKTRSEMGSLLGVPQQRLSEWATGKKQVPWDKLALAKELSGKSWDWMLGAEEDENSPPTIASGEKEEGKMEKNANLANGMGFRLAQFLQARYPFPYTFEERCKAIDCDPKDVTDWIEGAELIPDGVCLTLMREGCDIAWLCEGKTDKMVKTPFAPPVYPVLPQDVQESLEATLVARQILLRLQARILEYAEQDEDEGSQAHESYNTPAPLPGTLSTAVREFAQRLKNLEDRDEDA